MFIYAMQGLSGFVPGLSDMIMEIELISITLWKEFTYNHLLFIMTDDYRLVSYSSSSMGISISSTKLILIPQPII
jgi:hypothetical protein